MKFVASIAQILVPVVIGVGFFFAYRQWKAQRNARMAQIVMSLSQWWESREMVESRQKVNQHRKDLKKKIEDADSNDNPELYPLIGVLNFFETLGVLVMQGYLERSTAYDLSHTPEQTYHGAYQPILDDPKYRASTQEFRDLHEEFQREEKKRSKRRRRSAT